MKLKEIHRTATFAWSPFSSSLPLLATGTVAGALDESFSDESLLEIWAPDFLARDEYDLGEGGQHGPKGFIKDTARFNRLAWGYAGDTYSQGVIAAGLENGELALWNPSKILSQSSDALILRNSQHTGPIRGLDFNPIQTSLLSSGGVNGEVYIWDLKDPSKPYTPGTRSTKLDEMTSVGWNRQVQYVLAGASTTGYTVVWDLRNKREVCALAYGGGAGTLAGQTVSGQSMAAGGRRGMSDIAWHPENATRLVTASEDDSSPVIMVWDLRNARAPEKILTGHSKGILSLSWCAQDSDLLLSCGKDNRTICWNPNLTGSELIGELPSADNWAFQVEWCPRNPDLLSTAFFDGRIGIFSVQSTNEPSQADASRQETSGLTSTANGADVFDAPGFLRSEGSGAPSFSLTQAPKWLRRPTSTSWGFGGKLVTVANPPSSAGKSQSKTVHLRSVVTETDFVQRAKKLAAAVDDENVRTFAEALVNEGDLTQDPTKTESWKALLTISQADSRDELIALLGFSKAEVAVRVAEAVEKLKTASSIAKSKQEFDAAADLDGIVSRPAVVSFVEPDRSPVAEASPTDDIDVGDDVTPLSAGAEKTPSEISAGGTSDATSAATRLVDTESTTTVPSLFGDDAGPGTPQIDGEGADFFRTIGTVQDSSQSIVVPHTNYGLDSSVAATIGSGPSSVSSESLKLDNLGFSIYPTDDSSTEKLVSQALVLGDFESAVSLCISSDRFADAILLAVRGGADLLARTQKAYFDSRTNTAPYLRLYQSIVSNDLADIVQNADLNEWREIFVVICTFAKGKEEFENLSEELGARLEFQYDSLKEDGVSETAKEWRKNATLTYLAAGRLEKLVGIWSEELAEEEEGGLAGVAESNNGSTTGSKYSARANALQSFIEKVTVFRAATKYKDQALESTTSTATSAPTAKLASLYDRYYEYAELLATQGLIKEASTFLKLTPESYKGSGFSDLSEQRDRVLAKIKPSPAVAPSQPSNTATIRGSTSYTSSYSQPHLPAQTFPVAAPSTVVPSQAPPAYAPYNPYTPATQSAAPVQTSAYNPYNNTVASLTQPPHLRQAQPQPAPPLQPPPKAQAAPLPPPPKRNDGEHWNDAPPVKKGSPVPLSVSKPAAITSPFPNASPSPGFTSPGPYNGAAIPPPPRPGSVTNQGIPPPPRGASAAAFSPPRPPSGQPSQLGPPSRMMSPSQLPPPPRQATPSQMGPPPMRGHPSASQVAPPVGQIRSPVISAQAPPGPSTTFGRPAPPQSGPYAVNSPPSLHQGGAPQAHDPYAPLSTNGGGPYTPPQPANAGPYGHPTTQPGPYAPTQQAPASHPPPNAPPPMRGPTSSTPAAPARLQKPAPPAPKYPSGDRSHIPDSVRPAYDILSAQLARMRQTTPPQQKRMVDDLERRLNPLFDALNCDTLTQSVVDQLLELTGAIAAGDRPAALAIHIDLLTRGSQTDDIGIWMAAIKQLIMRL